MKRIGIYKITSPTGRIYIGSSRDLGNRRSKYKSFGCKKQVRLYASIMKYGWDAHVFEVVEECEFEKLYMLERAWGLFYNVLGENGLNCRLPAYGDFASLLSEESRQRMSLAQYNKTPEHKANISKALTGKKQTPEHTENCRQAKIGVKQTPEHVESRIKHQRGRKHSQSQIDKRRVHLFKKVIDVNTNEIYPSLTSASEAVGISISYLSAMLNDKRKNITTLKYLKNGLDLG